MKFPHLILIVLFSIECGFLLAQDSLTIISYNVENLFDNQHDSLKNDSSFLPQGNHYWTYQKYQTKLNRIAQVIVNISGWESAALVGLCEVENARCLRDLCHHLKRFHYQYIHYESADERGIDVALLYDTTKVKILSSKPLRINLHNDHTRDILYACCLFNHRDTLHTMVCHLPSRLGGASTTASKRKASKRVIQQHIDSILCLQPHASIVVMGDMNSHPEDDLQNMHNMMINSEKAGKGTHKYQGLWSCLDQFYISHSLKEIAQATIFAPNWLLEEDTKYLDYQPKRTFIGFRYHDGYSDHLPVVLKVNL